jgi:hypothetical protein
MDATDPFELPSLLDALTTAETSVAEFFGALTPAEGSSRVGDAWTPAEHVASAWRAGYSACALAEIGADRRAASLPCVTTI